MENFRDNFDQLMKKTKEQNDELIQDLEEQLLKKNKDYEKLEKKYKFNN